MLISSVEVQAQGDLDGLMGRAAESAKRKAQDRVNQNIDQSIDKAIKKTEDTVKCVATDRECLRHAKEEGKRVEMVEVPTANDTMKCLVTDTGCMKQAKAQRMKVALVEESELDTAVLSDRPRVSQARQDVGEESRHHRLNSLTPIPSTFSANAHRAVDSLARS